MIRCDLFKHASGMAYVTLFSLIPSLAAIFGLISLFKPFLGKDSALLIKLKEFILSNLAAGSGETVVNHLDSFIANLDMAKIGLTGFAGILFSLILLLRQIELALNRIWLVKEPRNIFRRFVYFWTFLTLGTVIIGSAVGILSGFNLRNILPWSASASQIHESFTSYITPIVATFVFFTLLYKVVPNCEVSFKDAAIGAFPAAILFILGARSYGVYTKYFTNYQVVYGALAAVPLFIMWLYIMWLITLSGALLSWRSKQSFNLSESMDDESPTLQAPERLRNHYLQVITPFVALVAIYKNFAEGSGKGLTGNEIAIKLNLPTPWVSEALEFLLDSNLVISKAHKEGDEAATNHLSLSFFPAYPANSLKTKEIHSRFLESYRKWLEDWKFQFPMDLRKAVNEFFSQFTKHSSDDFSFENFLEGVVDGKS